MEVMRFMSPVALVLQLALLASELLPGEATSGTVAAAVRGVGTGRIVPALDPKDDGKFFKHDYPYDLKPLMEDRWSHPFPLVQGSKDYDRDYVKDENYDGGQWKLQSEYDTLRGKLATQWEAATRAERTALEKGRELETVQSEEKRAEVEAKREAMEALRKAGAHRRAALRKNDTVREVGSQQIAVEREAKQAEDCEKELAKARARLKDLQEQESKREAVERGSAVEADEAEAKQFKKEQVEAALEEKVAESAKEYNSAHRQYEDTLKRVERTEQDLKQSEAKLRYHRHHPNAVQSGAPAVATQSWLAAAIFTTAMALTAA